MKNVTGKQKLPFNRTKLFPLIRSHLPLTNNNMHVTVCRHTLDYCVETYFNGVRCTFRPSTEWTQPC